MDFNTVYKPPEGTSYVLPSTSDNPGLTPLLPVSSCFDSTTLEGQKMVKLSDKRLYLTRHGQAEHKFVRIA
jgi:hypothetical protein